ncbi:MAG: glycosyltransferase family 2 protein [Candidatus Falkowbacteria bacterium]
MLKKIAIIISPNYKDYARKYLAEFVDSFRKQDYAGEMKIFITDNESTEESYNYLKQAISEAEIIRNKNNDGFAKGNNDAMKLALQKGFDYIILFNMDTVLEAGCVRKVVKEAEDKKEVGAAQARIMLYSDKNKINSLGNVTHFLGFGYASGHGEEYMRLLRDDNNICYPSGAAVLFKREALEKIGLFDEEFWMYNEDQDLGWRLWLAGFRCVLAREAIVYHKYEFSRSLKKYYFMDRNRIIAMLKNYHWATLTLIAPAFLIMEIGLIFFALKGGWLKEKINVYKYFLSSKNRRYIRQARKQTQKLRQVKDKDIIKLFSGKIWYQEIGDAKLKVANVIFDAYWKLIKILIIW